MKPILSSASNSPIYLSTNGKANETAIDVANRLQKIGVTAFELTSGKYIEYPEKEISNLIKNGNDIILHNYFPPPREPFVINLASNNFEVLEKSIAQVKRSILISSEVGAKVFAVHAGFLVDLHPSELGEKINAKISQSKEEALNIFQKSIRECAKYARSLNVKLLIENNVLTVENYLADSYNPLLLTEPKEIRDFMESNSEYVGILLDTGHLNVSAQTLGFDRINALLDLREFVGGYQLSSNDGFSDQHLTFGEAEWFIPHLDWTCSYITLEVNLNNTDQVLRNLSLLKSKREQSK